MKNCLFLIVAVILLQACAVKTGDFTSTFVPSMPDYSMLSNWAAHPEIEDPADRAPKSLKNQQSEAQVDVFFLHPTTLTKKPKTWNASVEDAKINQKTDETSILYQASIFNAAAQVYAPRYRQAHLHVFYTKDKKRAKEALDLAYEDVRAAFKYYLEHQNQNRPIVIAGHSQGAYHGKRLLSEFFDEQPLQRKLVAAYLVGWPIEKAEFKTIPPCKTPQQTGCVCSWRTFEHGHIPEGYPIGDSILVTNPITWTTTDEPAPKKLHQGALLKKFDEIYVGIADAEIRGGILWTHKPQFPGSFFFRRKNYHIADLNFFYMDVRKNVLERVGAFWK